MLHALCEGNVLVTDGFSTQRAIDVMWTFEVFFKLVDIAGDLRCHDVHGICSLLCWTPSTEEEETISIDNRNAEIIFRQENHCNRGMASQITTYLIVCWTACLCQHWTTKKTLEPPCGDYLQVTSGFPSQRATIADIISMPLAFVEAGGLSQYKDVVLPV